MTGEQALISDLDFTAKRVLVTGGSSGIGNGIAQAFRARGAAVHVWGTRAAASDYSASEGSDLTGLGYSQVDMASAEAIAAAPAPFDEGVDIVVQSQGAVLYRRQEFEADGWSRVMAVNASSVMYVAQRFREDLARAKGALVIVASIAAHRATIGNPAYAASKAATVGLIRTLGKAWASEGIRVNGFSPGLVDTKLTKATTDHPDRLERALGNIPMNRLSTPEEMAGVALFLASPLAGYICGQTIIVDGGVTL